MNKKSLRVIVNNIRQEAISCRIAFDCSRFNWFTKDELGITENARQKDISDRNEYYDKANETQKLMLEWLDGISEKLNARHYKVKDDGEFQDIMKDMMKEGDVIISAPIKSVRRAVQKVLNDYNGDWSRLLDGVRATIAVDTLDEIPRIIELLRQYGMQLARCPKNRFITPNHNGYRDILLNIVYPNGFIGELQINVKPMILAKEGEGHDLYEDIKKILDHAEEQGRYKLEDDEQLKVAEYEDQLKDRNCKAWRIITNDVVASTGNIKTLDIRNTHQIRHLLAY